VNDIDFLEVVKVLGTIESTTQRTVMAKQLSSLLRRTPPDVIDKVIYFVLGELRPSWEGIELGVAEKLTLRAIAAASGLSVKHVEDLYKRVGDMGEAARLALMNRRRGGTILDFVGKGATRLTMSRVYSDLLSIAKSVGEGAQENKVRLLTALLSDAEPDEAKYIARFVIGKLRLGIADMTILDALADAFKVRREELERAYHVYPDLGRIAMLIATRGSEGLSEVKITPGVPIQSMLAERLRSSTEILAKLGGIALCEYKYDGERAQIHGLSNGSIKIFSRRLEDITRAYPDVVDYIKDAVEAKEYVIEGEIVAVDPDTGEFRPFQELMHRKRKYNIKEAMEEYPVRVFLFDALYIDGEDLTNHPLPDRRRILIERVRPTEYVQLANWRILRDPEEVDRFFHEAISNDCEGIICKSLRADSVYEMGARGWLWIKYKRDYRSELTDTMDLVVVGAFWGRGKRAGYYGALLLAAYDEESDQFYTVCKVGSGFTDEDLAKVKQILDPYVIPHRHARVVSKMEADVWFVPAVVLEITGAEITLSPLHTCCVGMVKPGVGLAVRFPRFTGRYRVDKSPEQATTIKEILEMYKSQRKVTIEETA